MKHCDMAIRYCVVVRDSLVDVTLVDINYIYSKNSFYVYSMVSGIALVIK